PYVHDLTFCLFFFHPTAPNEIYTLSLHDALPISYRRCHHCGLRRGAGRRTRHGPASPTAAGAGADFCGAGSLCHARRAIPPAVALDKVTREHATLPPLVCACASLRRAARAVTHAYDAELRKTGVNPMQFTL